MKKFLAMLLAVAMILGCLAACGPADNKETTPSGGEAAPQSEVEKIIAEAQKMSLEELAKKAIAESNGKTFYGVGNSSRGKSALPLFI
ncbi:MAG: hypothetical protein IKI82_05330, partial [Lachnospiraceae bacterium]|nr:hypothetical protein [Lachnospiraceae bacterium]